ncbi:hypothetical protein, unlikely [Trypanosoma brucei gambiense DAL972]|uniref:Uncharacterized protein n=1 Tax=Trypanosoma brucei gambiense (strain MHOM/CI/86/DAL972) TaxID=679716 RepID=D0A5D0_TRYB9|nr:hypothetical protein, unlikely [Trypanosoma brucei gambiense DAL972]CBH16474.1 hypothetical protein, unlikely [Trypanosoma brucei gambiense DAL972]|eukprot:XP_011778738.1 hypothetical protein, unlikely [Trypanosoma brucei gambiense DAL972]
MRSDVNGKCPYIADETEKVWSACLISLHPSAPSGTWFTLEWEGAAKWRGIFVILTDLVRLLSSYSREYTTLLYKLLRGRKNDVEAKWRGSCTHETVGTRNLPVLRHSFM